MSGKNLMATLRDVLGAGVGRVDQPTVPIDWIWPHPPGHKLRHPRIDDPVDVELRDDIVEQGVVEPFLVRIEYVKEEPVLALVDGACRKNSGTAAQTIMRKQGSKILDVEGNLKVKVRFFKGTDEELLLERQKQDRQPLKRPHSVRVLCDSICQMTRCNVETARILDVLTRDWTEKVVECVSALWHTAGAPLRKRLDTEVVPPGILPAVLKAPPAKREEVLDELLRAEVTSTSGATRALGVAARRRAEAELSTVDAAGAPDIEDDGLSAMGEDEDDDARRPSSAPPAAKGGSSTTKPRGREPRPRARVEAVSAKLVKRVVADLGNKAKVTDAEHAFVLAAQCGLGRDYASKHVVAALKDLPPLARSTVAGVLWRIGVFGAEVQKHVDPAVLALVADAEKPKAKPAKSPRIERTASAKPKPAKVASKAKQSRSKR